MANPPTPLGVAVDLADTGINPDANGADEGRFAEVGTETGPEVVIEVRPAVGGASVKRKPMSYGTEKGDEESGAHRQKEEE